MLSGCTRVEWSVESRWSYTMIDSDKHLFLSHATDSVKRIPKQSDAIGSSYAHIYLTAFDYGGTFGLILAMTGGVHAQPYAG